MRSFFVAALAFTSYVSAANVWRRQSDPPACSGRCLNVNTNNVPTGNCTNEDFVCLCTSVSYVQGVINCLATDCASHDDVLTAIQYSAGFCGVSGVNTVLPVTTPLSQLPASTASTNGTATTASGSSGGSSSSSSSATPTATPNGATASPKTPSAILGALVLAAGAVALQL
ncbi:hypothetical protein FRC17_006744 [Serendipita sp. 399]|nr:hypothetical protein FRC17_006744 [Serendipita sp. 399]